MNEKKKLEVEKACRQFAQTICEIMEPNLKPTTESRVHETIQTTVIAARSGFIGSTTDLCAAVSEFSGLPFKELRLFRSPIPLGKSLAILAEKHPETYQQRKSSGSRTWVISKGKVPPRAVPESRVPFSEISAVERSYRGPCTPSGQERVKKIEAEYNQPIKDVLRELAEVEELKVREIATRLQLPIVTVSRYCRKYGYHPTDLVY